MGKRLVRGSSLAGLFISQVGEREDTGAQRRGQIRVTLGQGLYHCLVPAERSGVCKLHGAAFSSWQGCLEKLKAIDASMYLGEVVSMCKSCILKLCPLAPF